MRDAEKGKYIGMAGHLAVMAELSRRGYNVAIPQIDAGDDIFSLNDETGDFKRVQVKTSNSPRIAEGEKTRRCLFSIKREKLNKEEDKTIYVLCALIGVRLKTAKGVRRGTRYRFLIFEREQLAKLANARPRKKGKQPKTFTLTVYFGVNKKDNITVSTSQTNEGTNLIRYLSKWSAFPNLLEK